MKKSKRIAVWMLLVHRGLVNDRKVAESWIMSGSVFVNERRVDVAGEQVSEDAQIRVQGLELKYVGRGGLKLEGALHDFAINVSGKIVLDTGASTGGFTDCLLQHGAERVYAIDVGHGQLMGSLRQNPRVVNMERTNIGDVLAEELDPAPSLATLDLSYLSLTQAIPIVRRLLAHEADMVCLVKPLFEVSDTTIRRTGVIRNPSVYVDVLQTLVSNVHNMKLKVRGVTHSHITGNGGTHEFFMWVSTLPEVQEPDIDREISESISRVLQV